MSRQVDINYSYECHAVLIVNRHKLFIPIVDVDFFAWLDVVCAAKTGDEAESGVFEGDELRVGDETVVGLVGEGGAVVLEILVGHGNVNRLVLVRGVEDLVGVLAPVGVVVVLPATGLDPLTWMSE